MAPPMLCCVIGCGKPAEEMHHVLPVAVVGRREADTWPIIPLCKRHHVRFHLLLTPASFHRRLEAIRAAKAERRQRAAEAAQLAPLPLFDGAAV